jgi:tyrosine decarboxylase/aspartate 1-decarboxylase
MEKKRAFRSGDYHKQVLALDRTFRAIEANLLNCRNGVGFVVSGGTEANLMALWAARNRSNANNPEVVVPESAHFSFDKICYLLGLKPVRAKLDNAFRAIPEEVEHCINDRPPVK